MFTGQRTSGRRDGIKELLWPWVTAGSGQNHPPTLLPPASPLPPSTMAASRNQSSPSRADPQSPAAGSGACAAAGEGVAVRGAGSPPGDCGAHSGRGAAATWAASPRQRGKSRIDGASGDRRRGLGEDSLRKRPPTSPNRARKHLQEPHTNSQNSLQSYIFLDMGGLLSYFYRGQTRLPHKEYCLSGPS